MYIVSILLGFCITNTSYPSNNFILSFDNFMYTNMERAEDQLLTNQFVIYSEEQAFHHMTRLRSDREQELYIKTDEALFYLWDANCLSIDDTHREEYLAYLPHVFDLLMASEDGQELIDYLVFIEESQYGVAKGDNLALERASRLVNFILDYKNRLL